MYNDKKFKSSYNFFVPGPVIRSKRPSQDTLSQSYHKIQQPKPTKQMVDLKTENCPKQKYL